IANPHFEHVIDADGDEAGPDFARGGPREVRLAAAGRTVHEDAAADRLAVRLVQLRVVEWVNDLQADLVLELVHSADVFKCRFGALDLGRRLATPFVPRRADPP